MLIEKIALKNIRSYRGEEPTELEIPEGIVLFEGDIGSGKSTILYAIEFALFGLGDMPGNYILSEGSNEGYVSLWFTVEGKKYEVHRGLKRKKSSVNQEDCYIVEDGKIERLSPSDLKARIIEVLRFNEPLNPRAGSLIFRYAIFTPQEQMKEIVLRNVDERLQILRRILGIEDYKVAIDNSDLLRRRLQDEARVQRQISSDLERKEEELSNLQEEMVRLTEKLPELEEEQKKLNEKVQELIKKQGEFQDAKGRVQEIARRIPILKDNIQRKRKDMEDSEKRKKKVELDIITKEKILEEFQSLKQPSQYSSQQLEEKLEKVRQEIMQVVGRKSTIEDKVKTTDELIREGVCPLCGQKIEPLAFSTRKEHLEKEMSLIEKEIQDLNSSKEELSKLINEMRYYEKKKEDFEKARSELSDLKDEYQALVKRISDAKGELELMERELVEANAEAAKLEDITKQIGALEEELRKTMQKNEQVAKQLESIKTMIQERKNRESELKKQIGEMKQARRKYELLTEYSNWVQEYLQPTIEAIERQVMTEMNARFNEQFTRFFSSLVPEPDLRVRVNEEFTPVFERQGYEQEFNALSGGERSSIALAYRLALNVIVQQEATAGAGELLILDEPTDGFSKEQLSRMRDVIYDCNCRQVIIVSHERELESMAEHIFLVEKVDGTSRITKVA